MPDITLLQGAIEAITANNLSDAKKHIESFIKQYDRDSLLALWFTPDAIQQHFEDGWDDRFTEWVDNASDEQLRTVGSTCIGADSLYKEFHYVLETEIQWQIDHPDDKKEDNMNDDKKLTALREKVRAALDAYEGALELALGGTTSGIRDYDDINTSLIQIQSARRVLWMDN